MRVVSGCFSSILSPIGVFRFSLHCWFRCSLREQPGASGEKMLNMVCCGGMVGVVVDGLVAGLWNWIVVGGRCGGVVER